MIWLIFTALACAADAWTTDRLIKAGGIEVISKWLVGARPSTFTCWFVFFLLPVTACAIVVYKTQWDVLVLIVGLLRGWYAWRNWQFIKE